MSRPIKTGLDYFPLDIETDDKIELLEAEHGIEGFGILIKLFQRVYKNGYWYKWGNNELLLFSKRINVDSKKVSEVIHTAITHELFDQATFNDHQVLTSQGIQKRYFSAIGRRSKIEIMTKYLLIEVTDYNNLIIVDNNFINVDNGTQTKLNKTKLKESKVNYRNIFDEHIKTSLLKFEDYYEWILYRIEKKKPLTERSIKQQLLFLSQQSDPVECVKQSIRNGWQGLFEVKTNGQQKQSSGASNEELTKLATARAIRQRRD